MLKSKRGPKSLLMPTVFVLLVAALFADLRLTAELVGLRVRAALHNDGDSEVTVVVGDKCAVAAPFTLVVDGKTRPFIGSDGPCRQAEPVKRTIAAGGYYAILSDSLDGRRHTIEARYDGIAAPLLHVETALRVDLRLAGTAHVVTGKPVDLELTHVNRSPEEVPLPACGEDRLLVDGNEVPWPATEACNPAPRSIKVRGAWVTRGRLVLGPGTHTVRGRWRQSQSNDVIVDVAP
jgi:hypothetical protein